MGPVGKYRCFYRLPDEPKPPLPSFSHFQRLFFNFFHLLKKHCIEMWIWYHIGWSPLCIYYCRYFFEISSGEILIFFLLFVSLSQKHKLFKLLFLWYRNLDLISRKMVDSKDESKIFHQCEGLNSEMDYAWCFLKKFFVAVYCPVLTFVNVLMF